MSQLYASICWHFVDTDGQPPSTGRYLAAEDKVANIVLVLLWNGSAWHSNDGLDSEWINDVVAWAEMPTFPTRPT